MLIECKKCGAPLDVEGNPTNVRCRYCGTTSRIRSAKTLAVQTPPDWKPPEVWAPRADARIAAKELRFGPAVPPKNPRATAVAVAVLGVVLLGFGGVVVFAVVQSDRRAPAVSASPGASWDGASILRCGREPLLIEDRRVTLPGVVIDATRNSCAVVFRRCNITGGTIVQGGELTNVRVEDSVLVASDIALTGRSNMRVAVRGRSTVKGGQAAIAAGTNLRVEIQAPAAIVSDVGDGIRAEGNLQLSMSGGDIRVAGVAIVAGHNARLETTSAHITGGRGSLALGNNAHLDLTGAVLEGERTLGVRPHFVGQAADMDLTER